MYRSHWKRRKGLQAWKRGLFAEGLAGLILRLYGYKILGRRVKTPLGEIDFLARYSSTLVAIEVKKRASLLLARESITPKMLVRIKRSLLFNTEKLGMSCNTDLRVDALLMGRFFLPQLIRNIA